MERKQARLAGALMTALLLGTTACGTDTGASAEHVDAAPSATSAAPTTTAERPNDQRVVKVPGTDLAVPYPAGFGLDEGHPESSKGDDGGQVDRVQFLLPGPAEGTTVGSMSVARLGPPASGERNDLARFVGDAGNVKMLSIAGTQVAYWLDAGAVSGEGLGWPDRNIFGYVFAAKDGTSLIELLVDGLKESDVRPYLESLITGMAKLS